MTAARNRGEQTPCGEAQSMFDDVNHLAALSLSTKAFSGYRDYREWLIASGSAFEQIVPLLALYVWDICECPRKNARH